MTTTSEDYIPFNFEHFKSGAPFRTLGEYPIRIICDNRETDGDLPIVGLVNINGREKLVCYNSQGKYIPFKGDEGEVSLNLFMTPLGYVQGKPVFVGDSLYFKDSRTPYKLNPRDQLNWANFSWEQKTIEPDWRNVLECKYSGSFNIIDSIDDKAESLGYPMFVFDGAVYETGTQKFLGLIKK